MITYHKVTLEIFMFTKGGFTWPGKEYKLFSGKFSNDFTQISPRLLMEWSDED